MFKLGSHTGGEGGVTQLLTLGVIPGGNLDPGLPGERLESQLLCHWRLGLAWCGIQALGFSSKELNKTQR